MSSFVGGVGVEAVKLPRKGTFARPRPTKLRVMADALYWVSKTKNPRSARVPLGQVARVMEGQNTKGFERFKDTLAEAKTRSLSIVYMLDNEEHSLDLVMANDADYQTFKTELDTRVAQAAKRFRDPETKLMTTLWEKADVNLDGVLSRKEVLALLQSMNVKFDTRYIMKLFAEVDVDKNATLDFEEFHVLVRKLRQRPELQVLWSAVLRKEWDTLNASSAQALAAVPLNADDQLKTLPLADFHVYLTKVQGQVTATVEDAKALLQAVDPENKGECLSFARFLAYSASDDNAAFDPAKAIVHQDMTQPLQHYFIASSHNTYLEGDQLNSASSVNRYINDLVSGCRCVELDCWDGPDGEPIVYHGHTLTGRILFRDIIVAVNKYAFQTSKYPIVLSLENHCHLAQQHKMAQYLKSILGDKLARPPVFKDGEAKLLPSPEALKGKVVIKGKRLSKPATPEEHPTAEAGPAPEGAGEVTAQNDEDEEEAEEDDDEEEEEASTKSASETSSPTKSTKSPSSDPKKVEAGKAKKPKISPELSDITWMPGVHFKGWEKEQEPQNCTSYLETKMEKYVGKHAREWVELNKRMFSRIYPAGLRVDSSNYNPIQPWTVGCQLVALNYQTPGVPMQINKGRFLENGNCGYVLKPPAMRLPNLTFHPTEGPFANPIKLEIRIISGQQLPKPKGAKKGEVIDPYVKVEIFGVPADHKALATKHIDDNGFNPVWDAPFAFRVKAPELAMLHLAVWDRDNGVDDDFIAAAAIPVGTLRSGYRKVPLSNLAGVRSEDFEFASLFVHIKVE